MQRPGQSGGRKRTNISLRVSMASAAAIHELLAPAKSVSPPLRPLLCAGLTTFNALRNSGARAGDLVAVLGIGGLGHLALQYARKMGFKVVATKRISAWC